LLFLKTFGHIFYATLGFIKSMVFDELKEKMAGERLGKHAMKSTAEAGPGFQQPCAVRAF
jgi:hypothetical protein